MRRLDIPFQYSGSGLPGSLVAERCRRQKPNYRRASYAHVDAAGRLRFSFPIEIRSSQEHATCQNRVRREYRKC